MDYDLSLYSEIPYNNKINVINTASRIAWADEQGKIKFFSSFSGYDGSLENLLIDFMTGIDKFGLDAFSKKSILLVGVYFAIEEQVTFTVRLSSDCTAELAKRNIDIEICGYPCSED